MQILIAYADPRWNDWVARVLSPTITAFDHRIAQIFAPAGTPAFAGELARVLAECEAVIALNPANGTATAPADWPAKALEQAAGNKCHAALVRAPHETLLYPDVPHLVDCHPSGTAESILAVARLLGAWRAAVKARFLLGPPGLIAHFRKDFSKRDIVVEYFIDSPGYVRTRWFAAEQMISPSEIEVRVQPLPPGSRIQLRVLAPDGEYESELSGIDRRVMDLSPTVAFDPREMPQFASTAAAT